MIVLPALSSVNDILDTDLVLVEHSTGEGFKMTGADLKNIMKAQAVDEVALNNMQSVSSNAVAKCLEVSPTEKESGYYFNNKRYHKAYSFFNINLVSNTNYILAQNFELPYNKVVKADAFVIGNNSVWSNDIKVFILSDGTLAVQSMLNGNDLAVIIDFYYIK